MDRYEEMLSRYKTDLDDAQVAAAVEKIVRDNLATMYISFCSAVSI